MGNDDQPILPMNLYQDLERLLAGHAKDLIDLSRPLESEVKDTASAVAVGTLGGVRIGDLKDEKSREAIEAKVDEVTGKLNKIDVLLEKDGLSEKTHERLTVENVTHRFKNAINEAFVTAEREPYFEEKGILSSKLSATLRKQFLDCELDDIRKGVNEAIDLLALTEKKALLKPKVANAVSDAAMQIDQDLDYVGFNKVVEQGNNAAMEAVKPLADNVSYLPSYKEQLKNAAMKKVNAQHEEGELETARRDFHKRIKDVYSELGLSNPLADRCLGG